MIKMLKGILRLLLYHQSGRAVCRARGSGASDRGGVSQEEGAAHTESLSEVWKNSKRLEQGWVSRERGDAGACKALLG